MYRKTVYAHMIINTIRLLALRGLCNGHLSFQPSFRGTLPLIFEILGIIHFIVANNKYSSHVVDKIRHQRIRLLQRKR